jgi:hypothetical protein
MPSTTVRNRRYARSHAWLAVVICCAWVVGLVGCKSIAPSNNRNWAADMAVLPRADLSDTKVTVHNVRNCNYLTPEKYEVRYYDRTYDLNKLDSVDFIVMPFSGHPELAHTMLAFGFEGKEYLDVSAEIRREEGEKYSTSGGFARQYELIYVVADERDAIRTTTNTLLRDVYVYRTVATPEQSRALFKSVFRRVNKLHDEPEFYNTVTNNCTTNILNHVNEIATNKIQYNFQVMLPGLADKLAYDRGLLVKHGTFEQTKAYARVNEAAFAHRNDPDFSIEIRRR